MTAPLNPAQIKRAGQLIEELERIEGELQAIFAGGAGGAKSGRNTDGQSASAAPKKRTMSAAARARIASAQRARWAKARENGTARPAKGKKKRTMSPEARAKIAAAQKKRWAKQRRGK